MNAAELEARDLQAEAVDLLCREFELTGGVVSEGVVRAVECIVLAATLRTSALMVQAS